MAEISCSWAKTTSKQTIEVEFSLKVSRLVRFRYWIARQLIALAAWIINSNIVFRETLSVLELESW